MSWIRRLVERKRWIREGICGNSFYLCTYLFLLVRLEDWEGERDGFGKKLAIIDFIYLFIISWIRQSDSV